MLLEIPEEILKTVKSKAKSRVLQESNAWHSEKFEHFDLDPADLPLLAKQAEKLSATDDTARRLVRRLKQLGELGKGKKSRNLEILADEMKALVQALPNSWVFVENEDSKDTLDPYVVSEVEYNPAENRHGEYCPAYIQLNAKAMRRGDTESVSGRVCKPEKDIDAIGIFAAEGWLLETEELRKAYTNSCESYEKIRQGEGLQLVATGTGKTKITREDYYGWERIKSIRFDRDGIPGRVILDDKEEWGESKGSVSVRKSLGKRTRNNDNEDDESEALRLPDHPYVRVFDTRMHIHAVTHVDNVDRYLYDRSMFDRMILSEDIKELIDALVTSDKTGDDLMAGKGKGVVILSSGPPGTGKTLTAETYAERAKKPLYSVQCSQLGLTSEKLEKELATVLERAMRWGAILLLDEADVYIRARGDDINQNAVVGVFLRLLEYYTGVLFMTTNRETLVDDAILSRCVVHVRYKVPSREDAIRVWRLMFELFVKTPLSAKLEGELVTAFANVSPRTVKQLCRLAKTMSERLQRPIDFPLFQWVARFQDTEKEPVK